MRESEEDVVDEVARYLDDVLRRAPMSPEGYEPDWADHPWQYKVYEHADRLALPPPAAGAGSLDGVLFGDAPAGHGQWSAGLMSSLLLYSYGLIGRRTRITGNPQQEGQIPYPGAVWARGSAAGGGLYPCEIYWVPGAGDRGLPGIYHYSAPHHAMNRIALGEAATRVREALGDITGPAAPSGEDAGGGYLLVTVKLWKNSFKYADFAYHCVTMDVGCLLATWHAIARSGGVSLAPRMWFAEAALDRLLNVDPLAESVFAVVPLPGAPPAPHEPPPAAAAPPVRVSEVERSARVTRWPRVERVHHAAFVEERAPRARALDPAALPDGAGDGVRALPAAEHGRLGAAPAEVLRNRKSSFGRFSANPPLPAVDLATLLAATARHPIVHPELRSPGVRTTRVVALVQHVDAVPRGVYDYAPEEHGLRAVAGCEDVSGLQQYYALSNYNLEQAAALVAIVARPHRFLGVAGARGYRLLNAEVGAIAQNLYLTAAALGVGCGAVLGFDNAALAPRLGLSGTDQWPMLLLMVGGEREGEADLASALSIVEPAAAVED
ncbi:hypothetical protein CFN78_12590 [Amycolatopsis antarctica]|uniref:Nitroreductase domain-containing protein n=1 Tax=Amycolatopsis antarctica TaxID=1854586 RepID=A0A263D3J8_9PSEU|nr:nitroreductase family protein [Amycolatopsis antarctica]OZM73052.1 hypothetical protein CFN78_12590 [Amycolatopsis antarctica]